MDNNQPQQQQIGYLLLNEDGAVVSSSGDLENDEKSAEVIMGLINLTGQIDAANPSTSKFKKLSLIYDDHCYIVCLSNRQVHVVKRTIDNRRVLQNKNTVGGGDAEHLSAVA